MRKTVGPRPQLQAPAAAALQAKLKKAVAFHQQGNLAEAERIYREILQRLPNHFDALHLLGVIAAQTRRTELAVELIGKAIGINAKVADAHSNRGNALRDLKRFEEALASYDRAIALKPDYAEAYSNRGNVLVKLKRLEEALASYDKALMIRPDFTEVLNNRGNVLAELKGPAEALASYDRALAIKPDDAGALYNRGNALGDLKRLDEALASYDRALALRPDYEAFNNRGNVLVDLKRPEEALASHDRAIALKPDYAEAYNNRGNALRDLKRFEEALASYDKALTVKSDFAAALNNRGNVLVDLKRPEEALASYDSALAIKPDDAGALYNRGNALKELKRLDEALASYDKALALKPDHVEAFNNRGNALKELKRLDEALASYDKALALKPDHAEAFNNRGNALKELKRLDEALASYDKALALKPDHAEAFNNRGNALKELKRLDEALASYDKALALKPDYAEGFMDRALWKLLVGQYKEGWNDYEWRWETKEFPSKRPDVNALPWRGEELRGRRLLVFSEQGVGDVIQFVRYLPLLLEREANVTFLTSAKLIRLLRPLTAKIAVISATNENAIYDFQCALMSLPHQFNTNLSSVPNKVPYLAAEEELVARWKARIGEHGFKIGIAWQGNPRASIDPGRSIPVVEFIPLSGLPGVRLISLQKHYGLDQLALLQPDSKIETLGDDFDNRLDAFVDTAAVMESLDLIITSDTSIAHLAGALGRPTWVALKHVPDWRWMLDRDDSPWYPTMRLFRQSARDDWRSVFAAIERQLRSLLGWQLQSKEV